MAKKKQRELPQIGAVFQKTYRWKTHTLTVVKDGQRIGYKVGKITYPSPSAAAKAITESEVNGWKFWSINS